VNIGETIFIRGNTMKALRGIETTCAHSVRSTL